MDHREAQLHLLVLGKARVRHLCIRLKPKYHSLFDRTNTVGELVILRRAMRIVRYHTRKGKKHGS